MSELLQRIQNDRYIETQVSEPNRDKPDLELAYRRGFNAGSRHAELLLIEQAINAERLEVCLDELRDAPGIDLRLKHVSESPLLSLPHASEQGVSHAPPVASRETGTSPEATHGA